MAAKRLKDTLDFLTALKSSGVETESNDKVQQSQENMLQSCLSDLKNTPAISMTEATQMLKDVQGANIPQWMQREIQDCVLTLTADKPREQDEGGQTAKNKLQLNKYLENYFTEEEWNTLRSSSHSQNTKLQVVCNRFRLLGLTCPREVTSVLGLSIVLLAGHQGPPENLIVAHHRTRSMLEDFKTMTKNITKRTRRSDILLYPMYPHELPEDIYNTAYPDGDTPVKCPLDIGALQMLAEDLPARNTRATLSNKRKNNFHRDDYIKENLFSQQLMEFMRNQLALPNEQHAEVRLLRRKRPLPLALMDGSLEEHPGEAPERKEAKNTETTPEPEKPQAEALPVDTPPNKSLEEMERKVREQLEHNKTPPAKRSNETEKKTSPAQPKAKKPKKEKQPPKTSPKTKCNLKYPGVEAQDPIHFGDYRIYTCPKSSNWRVQKKVKKRTKLLAGRKTHRRRGDV